LAILSGAGALGDVAPWHAAGCPSLDMVSYDINNMNTLERTLIEKAGADNGWECILESQSDAVQLASAMHPVRVEIIDTEPGLKGTEAERLVRQRVGQDVYRKSLLKYWKGQCAVTAIDVPEVLRASHAKPWADCETDSDRLNVYNGFLLSADLDALFDSGLISFDDNGTILISERLDRYQRTGLHIEPSMHLHWIDRNHLPYLRWHRENVFMRHK
jgi:putative restriction endonuclease